MMEVFDNLFDKNNCSWVGLNLWPLKFYILSWALYQLGYLTQPRKQLTLLCHDYPFWIVSWLLLLDYVMITQILVQTFNTRGKQQQICVIMTPT